MAASGYCLVCDKETSKLCTRCNGTFYCGTEHKRLDARSHKEYCNAVVASKGKVFDAILFAVNESRPRLIKLPWKNGKTYEFDPPWQDLNKDLWYKHKDTCRRFGYIDTCGINGPELGYCLAFMYDDNFMGNELPVNRCLEKITKGQWGHVWCGPIVALRQAEFSSGFYANVQMEKDLPVLVQYFEDYGKSTHGLARKPKNVVTRPILLIFVLVVIYLVFRRI